MKNKEEHEFVEKFKELLERGKRVLNIQFQDGSNNYNGSSYENGLIKGRDTYPIDRIARQGKSVYWQIKENSTLDLLNDDFVKVSSLVDDLLAAIEFESNAALQHPDLFVNLKQIVHNKQF